MVLIKQTRLIHAYIKNWAFLVTVKQEKEIKVVEMAKQRKEIIAVVMETEMGATLMTVEQRKQIMVKRLIVMVNLVFEIHHHIGHKKGKERSQDYLMVLEMQKKRFLAKISWGLKKNQDFLVVLVKHRKGIIVVVMAMVVKQKKGITAAVLVMVKQRKRPLFVMKMGN